MFLKNTWYVACTPDEFADKPLGRKVCNEAMVFFREANGNVAALEDFCPHRGAALSLGFVKDGHLVCGYHGLTVDGGGKCTKMVGQRVGGFPKTRAYPCVERYGFVWVWPGDAALANPDEIPHLEWAVSDQWAYGGGLYHIKCDYRLMIDNLMDLTHETYVHATSIGQDEIEEAPPKTTVEGDSVITARHMENIKAPPFWASALRANGLDDQVPCDRWQVCRFTPPSHVMIEVGVAHAGHGGYDAPADKKAGSIVVDFITPETDESIWYFWGMARNFKPEDAELTAAIKRGQGGIFAEDQEVLEAQQRNLSAYPEKKILKLNIDAGGVQSRKVLDRLIEAERAAKGIVGSLGNAENAA